MTTLDRDDVQQAEQLTEVLGSLWQNATLASRAIGDLPVLPPAQAEALHHVVQAGESAPTRLAGELNLSRPMISEIVRRLEEHRLVERRRSTDDGRSVVLTATDRGRFVHEHFRRGVVDVLTEGLRAMPQRDVARIEREMPALVRLLEEVVAIAERSTAPEERTA